MALISLLRRTGHLSRAQLFSLATASLTKITPTASAKVLIFVWQSQCPQITLIYLLIANGHHPRHVLLDLEMLWPGCQQGLRSCLSFRVFLFTHVVVWSANVVYSCGMIPCYSASSRMPL